MIDLVIIGGGAAALAALYIAIRKRQTATRSFDVDVNEGIEPAVEGPIDIDTLREDRDKLDKLRGKVKSVVYYEGYGLNHEDAVGESWLIDSNGATIEIDKRRVYDHGRVELGSLTPRNEPVGRNAEIEKDARWLANVLDVPLET